MNLNGTDWNKTILKYRNEQDWKTALNQQKQQEREQLIFFFVLRIGMDRNKRFVPQHVDKNNVNVGNEQNSMYPTQYLQLPQNCKMLTG